MDTSMNNLSSSCVPLCMIARCPGQSRRPDRRADRRRRCPSGCLAMSLEVPVDTQLLAAAWVNYEREIPWLAVEYEEISISDPPVSKTVLAAHVIDCTFE